jgi:hypothetical protein
METKQKTENELIAEWGYHILEDGTILSKRGKPLKLSTGSGNYLQANVYNKGKSRTFLVHRLVAMKFLLNPNKLPEVNHKDTNKKNNHYKNLEWCTRPQNIQHAVANGLMPGPWLGKSGKDHSRSKAVYQCDGGAIICEHGSVRQAAKTLNIHHNLIYDNIKGKLKSAGGFQWKYKQ